MRRPPIMAVQMNKLCGLCVWLVALSFASTQLRAGVGTVFQPQTRVGFTVGDQWEPSIAADRYGHVYILIPQYTTPTQPTIPGCPTCPSPTMFLVMSNDNGNTSPAPRIISPPASHHIDVQIPLDPVDGRTVYASWLQNNKSVIDVAK